MVVKGMNLLMNFYPWACFSILYLVSIEWWTKSFDGEMVENHQFSIHFKLVLWGHFHRYQHVTIHKFMGKVKATNKRKRHTLLSTFHQCWASGFSAGFETIDDAEAAQAGRHVGDFGCNLVWTGWCRRRGRVKSILGEKPDKTHEKWGKLRMIDPAKGCRRMIALNSYVDTFDHMILLSWKATPASAHQTIVFILFILVKLLCVVYHFWPPGREVYEISINRAPVKPAAVPYYLFRLVLGKKLRSWVGT